MNQCGEVEGKIIKEWREDHIYKEGEDNILKECWQGKIMKELIWGEDKIVQDWG